MILARPLLKDDTQIREAVHILKKNKNNNNNKKAHDPPALCPD
jgi:hypothetical protein